MIIASACGSVGTEGCNVATEMKKTILLTTDAEVLLEVGMWFVKINAIYYNNVKSSRLLPILIILVD